MITLEVIDVGGMPPLNPMSAQIDERGGTLGRSPDCTLVLVDEKRAVSRIHGQISYRNGQFLIEDLGTNPLKVNGVPVGKGNNTPLADGDRIVIGPYSLAVRSSVASPRVPTPSTPARKPLPSGVAPSSAASVPSGPGNPFDDIFGLSSGAADPTPGLGVSNPFDDLGFGPAPEPKPVSNVQPTLKPITTADPFGAAAGLPADFDPMARFEEPPPPAGAGLPDDAFGSLIGAPTAAPGEGSLDALFGLSSGGSSDPFAGSPLDKPPPSHAGGTDSGLTQFLGGIKPPVAAPVADKVPEINSAFTPPRAVPTPAPPALPDLDDLLAPAPMAPAAPSPTPSPRVARAAPVAAPAAPRPRSPGEDAASGALLEAFMAGLRAPDLVIDELTPELMHKIGALMHEATAGTIALLNARGTVKREMRADVTMIASGRNNPLKFSPDARLALRYLFGPPMPGFMDAGEAMQDAYADLRAHEFGFMAGLRAALTGVLKRFEPEQLESRIPEKGGLNALLPANRKAKLWDLFSELYRHLTIEAEEDFHALFGREFLRAYEEHVAAIERGQKSRNH